MQWSTQVDQGAWIDRGLDAFAANSVTSHVPRGFPAYARVLHPMRAPSGGGRPVRWSRVAAWSGVPLEPGTPYRRIALPAHLPTTPAPWDLGAPWEGSLEEQDAHVLVNVLAAQTPPEIRCWFAIWDGWGELRGRLPAEIEAGPRLLAPDPYRSHLLLTGEVGDALALLDDRVGLGAECGLTPALWWPQDRSWCVATDVDDDVTYVAGSSALIEQVHAEPGLETQPAAEGEPALRELPEDWLAELLEPAARRLLADGEVEVATALGSLLCRLLADANRSATLEIAAVGHVRWTDHPTLVPLPGRADAGSEIAAALRSALGALLY